jgi:hypothetical protein
MLGCRVTPGGDGSAVGIASIKIWLRDLTITA